jgi:hypothetical protein
VPRIWHLEKSEEEGEEDVEEEGLNDGEEVDAGNEEDDE